MSSLAGEKFKDTVIEWCGGGRPIKIRFLENPQLPQLKYQVVPVRMPWVTMFTLLVTDEKFRLEKREIVGCLPSGD